MVNRFSYIIHRLVAAPTRQAALLHVACICTGSLLSIAYLRGYVLAETIALALLGAAFAVPVAMLCIAISQKAAILLIEEEIRREMEKARKAREEKYQKSLTKFLEDCIEEDGGTPVWKSEDKQ